jgi:hypothetical protein
MASKRLRRDANEGDMSSTPNTPEAAVAAIRQLMRQFSLDPVTLEDDDSGRSLSLSYGLVC